MLAAVLATSTIAPAIVFASVWPYFVARPTTLVHCAQLGLPWGPVCPVFCRFRAFNLRLARAAHAPASVASAQHTARPRACARSSQSSCARRASVARCAPVAASQPAFEVSCTPPGWPQVAILGSVAPHSFRCTRWCAGFDARRLARAALASQRHERVACVGCML